MNRRLLLLLLAYPLSPASVAPLAGQPAAPPKRVALVVQAYDNRRDDRATWAASGFTNGPRDLAKELTRHGWDARLWASSPEPRLPPPAEEAPTEANLRGFLKSLAALRAGDEVIVVLVGQLVSLEGGGPGKGGGARLYFCPEDAQYQKLARAAEVKAEHRLLALAEVYDSLKACPARQKLLILVTALSVTLGQPEKYPPPLCARLPKLPAPPGGLAVLTSCAEGEFTGSRARFLDALREGLAGLRADGAPDGKHHDGAVTAEELVAYARAAAEDRGERRRFPQHPAVLGRLPRDWVLAGKGPVAAATPPKRVALVALAYDNRNWDLARQVRGFGGCDRRLAKELTRHGWEARLWASSPEPRLPPPADEAPNEANLRRFLKGLSSLQPADEVVVVLVGHFVALEGGGMGKGDGSRLYFCPEDAQFQKLARAAEVKAENRLLALEEVYDSLKACPARKKLLVLVTAISTSFSARRYPPPLCSRLPELPAPPGGLAVLTSCAEGEFTGTTADFLDKLQEGLAGLRADGAPDGKHRDGAVTAEELIAYARAAVEERGERLGFPQHPTVLGRLPRDWVLAGKAAASRWKLLAVPFPAKQAQERQVEVAKLLKREGRVLTNGLGMKLALIPPGEFRLGSDGGYDDERPRPRIRLPRPFFLGQHEVTQAQYQRLMGDNPSFFRTVPGQDTATFPVEQVSFKQAVLFCNALSEREKLTPYYRLFEPRKDKTGRVVDFRDYAPAGGPGYRLPTEAEWEWACRAGSETAFAFGDEVSGKQANVDAGRPGGVKAGAYLGRPARVGSYAPNAWGLYDMHGNVAERVEESYDPRRYKELAAAITDGSGGIGYGGLVRGGAWNFPPQDCRSAVRLALPPDTAPKFVGLRVARDAE